MPSSKGSPLGDFTRDHCVLADGHRGLGRPVYQESGRIQALAAGQPPAQVKLPVGFATFPGDIFRALHSQIDKGLPHSHLLPRGWQGRHFAAWEEPRLFQRRFARASDQCVIVGRREAGA